MTGEKEMMCRGLKGEPVDMVCTVFLQTLKKHFKGCFCFHFFGFRNILYQSLDLHECLGFLFSVILKKC